MKSKTTSSESGISKPKSSQKGFTLIEVLVAVAILGIGLLAIIRVTGIAVRNTEYLQQKAIAHWVAMDVMANARAGVILVPSAGATQAGQKNMLDQNFRWRMTATQVANLPILRLQVQVLNAKSEPLDTVQTFIQNPRILS